MKLGVVDIGSNAARIQISNVLKTKLKKIEYVRFPLQLGKEVFKTGNISEEKAGKLLRLIKIFKLLVELYEVDHYTIYATSAMREAENAEEIIKHIKKKTGFKIKVISGEKEAKLINNVIVNHIDKESHLHIDVGGGSTELNFYQDGIKAAAESFKIGTIRNIIIEKDNPERIRMKEWIRHFSDEIDIEAAIGTGGNIRKLFDLSEIKDHKILSVNKLKEIRQKIIDTSLEDRINEMLMNEDRAGVIIPASDIYLSCMRWAGVKQIHVPAVGLKDGMLADLWKKNK